MHATFVTLWLQVVQPLANVHETKWTPHVKRDSDVAQSYTSPSDAPMSIIQMVLHDANMSIIQVVLPE